MQVWQWILELTGSKSSSSMAYNFWSGFGGDITIILSFLAAPIVLFRKNNCHVRWCFRIGRHGFSDPETGLTHNLCRKHHPDHPGSRAVTAEKILHIHRKKVDSIANLP
jgi:hypothetical protein